MTYQLELEDIKKDTQSHQKLDFDFSRLPIDLQIQLEPIYHTEVIAEESHLKPNTIYCGDARALLPRIAPNSVALAVWSPPYFVGKEYEADLTFEGWKNLLRTVIQCHF
ncbi:MAG: site-specific DNA-methyltransferase, partial [Anaerolineae bacterium]|nr:site-specific DNA-methyltransferase [Anaerolineae bacterium]